MAITNRSPAAGATIAHSDTFSFDIDDTYTSLVIKVQTATSLETAYTTAGGGTQAGYTIVVADDGAGTHTFTVGRDSGFSEDPTSIDVVEDETGTEATTSWTYDLSSTQEYPEGMQPYNGVSTGSNDPDAIHDNVANEISAITEATPVAGDWVLFEDVGSSGVKKKADANVFLGGGNLEIEVDGVSASASATKINFASPLVTTEPVADEFKVVSQARNHSLTSHGAETVLLLWQGDGTNVDDTGNHTMLEYQVPEYGPGAIPGTKAGFGTRTNANFYYSTGSTHRRGLNEAVSAYCMFRHSERNTHSTPFLIYSGVDTGTNPNYLLFYNSSEREVMYQDASGSYASLFEIPTDEWMHVGFTRSAANIVKIYVNGALVGTSGTMTPPTPSASSNIWLGTAGFATANGYWNHCHLQSVKIVAAELTAAQMLSECRRMFGK